MKKHYLTRCSAAIMACILSLGIATPVTATEAEKEPLTTYYSSADFEAKYTYTGSDLGATWTKEKTTFRVWAPTATSVKVNLYQSGTPGTDDRIEQLAMTADANGTWVAQKDGDLNGTYYTYLVEVDGVTNEACDPYARTTGVNGQRAMVIDLDSTDPEGWANDKDPHYDDAITDAVIYELHVRDLSIDASSGIPEQYKGKFLGLIQSGTTNSQGIPTGLDHIKDLGVTHIHLLPSYDYASVDETNPDAQFNWGYDPLNYNVPEGSYSTDPYNGEVRVKEFKQMIQGLHNNGISLIMDVVYNHVYDAGTFCFNKIVPQYFSRVTPAGSYSNGSLCGNDNATERSMVKKYIVDSVKYWADEYHIDGFRFDLAGLIDVVTINEVIDEVHKTHPNVFFYGEGWKMTTIVTKDGYDMAIQNNSTMTPGFAYFSDAIRDALRGPRSNYQPGYISGGGGTASTIAKCFTASQGWCKSPTQVINYASCHDDHTLFDRITLTTKKNTVEERIRMNNLAAAIVLTSQGTPFIHAGEEILRSKPLGDGKFEHNSYKSSDAINSLKWDHLNDPVYMDVNQYYKGLIAFRKAHPALRMTTAEDIAANITKLPDLESNVNAFHINGGVNGEESHGLVVIFNPKKTATTVNLPEGEWVIYINGEKAGTTALGTAEGSVSVDAISTMVLVQEQAPAAPEQPAAATTTDKDDDGSPMTGIIIAIAVAAALAIGTIVVIVVIKRKK